MRCVDHASTRRLRRALWTVLTHLGGTACSVAVAAVPLVFATGALHQAARHATLALIVSHLVVQLVKRTVNRPRPSLREATASLVIEPDKFSFPSGHSCAAMAVAFAYALAFRRSRSRWLPSRCSSARRAFSLAFTTPATWSSAR